MGDVVFATTRPYLRSVAMIPEELDNQICSTGFCVLRPTDQILPEWLFYLSLSAGLMDQITPLMRGANYPAVTDRDILAASVPVPSVDEQSRIVARIMECMERIDEIEECGDEVSLEMEALYPSTLSELFGEIAAKCGVCHLEEVTEIKGGGSLPKGQTKDPGRHNGVLLVKVGDMNEEGNERIISTSRAFVHRDDAGKKVIPQGAVLFPKRGGAIATNKKRMLGRPALVDPNMMAVIADPDHLLPEFLYYWTQTFKLESISNGGVIPQLNKKDLAPLEIPVPGLEEQALFVSRMEQAEAAWFEMVETHTQAVKERAALRESILRKAFAGEL
jgi:type I restriction enzyme, S subunit